MAAQLGKRMLLYIGDGATSEQFTLVGGLRTTRITINNTSVDVTDKQSDSWTELLANAGGRNIAMSVEGIYKGSAGETALNTAAMGGDVNNYRMVFEDDDKMFSGAWQCTSLEHSGGHQDARMFSASFASSGEITYGNTP